MEPFIVNCDITDTNQLYGRDKIINTLVSCAKRRENAGIIGARRFGKTCLLKSMESYLNTHTDINAIPVFFDVKSQTTIHKNTSEVYYTMAALLAKKMCELGLLEEGEFRLSRRCKLDISTDILDMMVQMKSWHSEYQEDALFILANEACKRGKFVLLLLDEIDSLLLDALNTPSDFGRIRGAALDASKKLKIWIAGTVPWKSMTTKIGSPELNCGLENIRLSSIDKADFESMWRSECNLVEDEILKERLLSFKNLLYQKTGGIPYYAKFIGSSFVNGTIDSFPDYTIIRDYLCEIYDNRFMTEGERSTLKILAIESKSFEEDLPDDISALVEKGLVSRDNNTYSIISEYLSDYIKAKSSNNSLLHETIDIEKREREVLVDEIARLRDTANKAFGSQYPFLTSTEDPMEFNTLKILCTNEATICSFATSLCKLFYEGSDLGRRLPIGFISHDFCNMVRALRNKYDHRICEARQMDDRKLFAIINNGIEPFKREHFGTIQNTVLNLFRDELLDMVNQASKKKVKSTTNIPHSINDKTKFLEDQKEYEGIIVSSTNGFGQTFLDVKCNQHAYPLKIISAKDSLKEGDLVYFTAIKEPNKKDPKKTFWKADNVRLKG